MEKNGVHYYMDCHRCYIYSTKGLYLCKQYRKQSLRSTNTLAPKVRLQVVPYSPELFVHICQIQIQRLNVQAVDAMATSLSLLPIADKKESRFEVPNAKPLLGDIDIHFVHFKPQYVHTYQL